MTRPRHIYQPISTAPKDGRPIVGVCGGVEMAVAWDNHPLFQCWVYWEEDEGGAITERPDPQPTEWRRLF